MSSEFDDFIHTPPRVGRLLVVILIGVVAGAALAVAVVF